MYQANPPTLSRDRGDATLHGFVTPRLFDIISRMPGRRRFIDKRRTRFELSTANIEYLKKELPDLVWGPEFDDRFAEINSQREAAEKVRQLKALPTEGYTFEFKTKPHEHQRKAFFLGRDQRVFAYLMEMGTGKSKVLLDNIAHLWAEGKINGALIVAPNGVHRQWVREQIPTHMPEWVPYKALAYKPGTPSRVLREIRTLLEKDGRLPILTMNVEAFQHPSGKIYAWEFLNNTAPLMAIDESTRIKTIGAKRTRTLIELGARAVYRRILSGSPVTKGVEDLFAQIKFLDPDVLGFSSFYTFRNMYCVMGGFDNKQVVGYQNLEDLTKKLDGISFRVTKDECLDLPPKIYKTVEVELSKMQRQLYDQLKENFFLEVNGEVVDVAEAIVRLLRFQQIVSGLLPDPEDPSKVVRIPGENPRIEAVKDILEDVQGKTIVRARFREDIKWLNEALKMYNPVIYDGSVKSNDRDKAIESFMTDPNCRVFIGNQAAAGIGLNLTAANTVIYYSNSFDAEHRWQSEDRCHRIGQLNHVTYIDLVAPKTIDRAIVRALRKKKNVADLVVDRRDISAIVDAEETEEDLQLEYYNNSTPQEIEEALLANAARA